MYIFLKNCKIHTRFENHNAKITLQICPSKSTYRNISLMYKAIIDTWNIDKEAHYLSHRSQQCV